jgi:hypothetical protein
LIQDEATFANFAKDMLAVEEFKWTLKGKLDITALTRYNTIYFRSLFFYLALI